MRVVHLQDAFGARNLPKPIETQVRQRDAWFEETAKQAGSRFRAEDLAAVRC